MSIDEVFDEFAVKNFLYSQRFIIAANTLEKTISAKKADSTR